jgi:FKBP-type peptidyl-prolyl cis-trans isomerase FkpA
MIRKNLSSTFVAVVASTMAFTLVSPAAARAQEGSAPAKAEKKAKPETKSETKKDAKGKKVADLKKEDIKELVIEDTKVGTGTEAVSGKQVTVHYTGTFVGGRTFDSSVGKQPFSFQLGSGMVIKGWDQGVAGMKVGGKRKLAIPSDLAYGPRGAGNVIPPNEPLLFEVELLEVK